MKQKDFRVDLIFNVGASSVSASYLVAVQDAIMETSIKARDFGFCKVEFNQPSYWLYSVPNLLVF